MANRSPMPQCASFRPPTATDSAFVKGSIANTKGKYSFTDLKKGKYILEANYIGYSKSFVPFAIASKNVALDTVRVYEEAYLLKEATVVGVKTPIRVMQDTVEFNADTYKTPPNAVVEDLLKRLPGVEVDTDGKITANGKSVTKILIDGKEFFSDDPKVASKNLPVNMVAPTARSPPTASRSPRSSSTVRSSSPTTPRWHRKTSPSTWWISSRWSTARATSHASPAWTTARRRPSSTSPSKKV